MSTPNQNDNAVRELADEEGELLKLEQEIEQIAQKVVEYRTTFPDRLKSTLDSVLASQRPDFQTKLTVPEVDGSVRVDEVAKERKLYMGEDHTAQPPSETTLESIDALLEAARYDDIEDVVSIASSGVSLDSKDSEGRTALHMAAANGHLTIVDYLISNGVDVDASNMEKNTPLHWACLNGHVEAVKRLVLAGASVSSLNSHERTPMDEAVSRGKMDVVDAINSAVAELELSRTTVS